MVLGALAWLLFFLLCPSGEVVWGDWSITATGNNTYGFRLPIEGIGVIGHDNATGRYQAASFDSMGTSISVHIGESNNEGDIVLHLSYQDQTTSKMVNRRTVRTLVSENEWVETAYETRNGTDQKVMEIRARRMNASVPKQH